MASAAMDRLLHHAHLVEMNGHSYRNPPAVTTMAAAATTDPFDTF